MTDVAITTELAREFLKDVSPKWKAFWFHMHLVANNLEDFAAGLEQIGPDVFAYHVSGQKNDIAGWVHEVIGDSVLARELKDVADAKSAAAIVKSRVTALKQVAGN